ncbi:MAG: SGNH/GDSL hydrolase family protein [Christensenellales bacterium]|jgi:acyl-CoA thioesterase-1
MKNIIAFGDSIVKGVSLEDGRYRVNPQRFTTILEDRMNILIENKGQMGATVMQLGKAIKRSIETLTKPEYDTIILSYGGNDCDYDWQAISEAPEEPHFCKTIIEQFTQEYKRIILKLKDMGKQVFLLSLPPIDAHRYFRFISRDRNADAILGWLRGDISHLMKWHEMFNLAVFKIGAAAKAKVLDITSCFFSKPNYKKLLCEDGIHPNSEGHLLIADTIAMLLSA